MYRCSEIHETLDECYDEENLLCQIQSAVTEVGDLCLDSIEKDGAQSDFVLVDAPDGVYNHDINFRHCPQHIGVSKTLFPIKQRDKLLPTELSAQLFVQTRRII